MLCNSKPRVGVTAQAFAEFNEQLYYDARLPVDHFTTPEAIDTARIKPIEVQNVLE